jgi:hypothetical protein
MLQLDPSFASISNQTYILKPDSCSLSSYSAGESPRCGGLGQTASAKWSLGSGVSEGTVHGPEFQFRVRSPKVQNKGLMGVNLMGS